MYRISPALDYLAFLSRLSISALKFYRLIFDTGDFGAEV